MDGICCLRSSEIGNRLSIGSDNAKFPSEVICGESVCVIKMKTGVLIFADCPIIPKRIGVVCSMAQNEALKKHRCLAWEGLVKKKARLPIESSRADLVLTCLCFGGTALF